MDRSDVVNLIKVTYTTDAIGQKIPTETSRIAYCKVRSVSSNEWFKGAQAGLKAQYEVTMFRHDYDGEEIVQYNDTKYGVYRTYVGNGDNISLYLEEKAGL